LEYVQVVVRGAEGRFNEADATIRLRPRAINEKGAVYTR
jgi:hypothetical protein